MIQIEAAEREVQELLKRLYDETYEPPALVYALLGCNPEGGIAAVQTAVIRSIAALAPPASTPVVAFSRRVHDVLHYRYVERLTLEETAELLGLSVRHLARIQRTAVRALTRTLCARSEDNQSNQLLVGASAAQGLQPLTEQDVEWREQLEQELQALEHATPGLRADVAEILLDVLGLGNTLTGGVRIEVGYIQDGLVAALHPAALRQMLITAIAYLARHVIGDRVTLFARLEGGDVFITLTGQVTQTTELQENELVRSILLPPGASVKVHQDGEHVFVWLQVPSEGVIDVLVIDDNTDMARFYQRATEGTPYRILHVSRGQDVFPAVARLAPDIIVLDVMLPDVDGWRLLMHLHENPATRHIPVIICSVVPAQRLALSLGAVTYIAKPVTAQQFVQTLDQVLSQV